MRILIDIPEENYDNKTLVDYFGCYSKMLDATIYNGTPIPDNATNGDMIRTIFDPETSLNIGLHCTYFWWNAPYQKGGTSEKRICDSE